jgi:hypothetical protein
VTRADQAMTPRSKHCLRMGRLIFDLCVPKTLFALFS